jgi:hypothetical protein
MNSKATWVVFEVYYGPMILRANAKEIKRFVRFIYNIFTVLVVMKKIDFFNIGPLYVWFLSDNSRYRKSEWFGPNFDVDAWLRPNGVLHNTAIGAIFLILIWASFSVHIVGTYFCSTVLFEAKNLKFLDFRFCGWFGPDVFLKAF